MTILNTHSIDYHYIVLWISKSESIHLFKNSDLSGLLWNIKNLLRIV